MVRMRGVDSLPVIATGEVPPRDSYTSMAFLPASTEVPPPGVEIGIHDDSRAHLRIGGILGELGAVGIAWMIYRLTGVTPRAVALIGKMFGLAVVELRNPEQEAPFLRAKLHQSVWMSSEAVYWIDTTFDPDAARKKALLSEFVDKLPQGCKRPRRLTTCEPWTAARVGIEGVFAQ